ncbi:MAG: hypothetical protein K2W96_24340, partial [Gemmataceae bacterium]|nr:hypothetical protein [Gemmataceae bacterium]
MLGLLLVALHAGPIPRTTLAQDAEALGQARVWHLRYREDGHRAWVAFGLYAQKDGTFGGPANLEVRIPDGLAVAGTQTMDKVEGGKVVGTRKVTLYSKKGDPSRLTTDRTQAATNYRVYRAPSMSSLVEEKGERFVRLVREGDGDIVFRYRVLGKTIRLECVKCERLGPPLGRKLKEKLQAVHFTGEFSSRAFHPVRERWTPEKAANWAKATPWLAGGNYLPASAINQLEMWQKDTFDPDRIDKELGWAEDLGFNSMRVFLHHLLWEDDKEGFLERLDKFLAVCEKRKIRPMLVLFDSCWDPDPKLGKQREPQKGVHNSGWVQSPGSADLKDKKRHKLLEDYVKGVVGRFKDDKRVICWDVWNEPDNTNANSYGDKHLKRELKDKLDLTLPLL